jgi:hypothetical protein
MKEGEGKIRLWKTAAERKKARKILVVHKIWDEYILEHQVYKEYF